MTLKLQLQTLDVDETLIKDKLDLLIDNMLDNIGSTDSELRDTLILNTFGKLIMDDYLSNHQMKYIVEICLDKLFYGIGKFESDSVFTRSFSSLIIGMILHKDSRKSFLTEELVLHTIDKSLTYLNMEKDIRGYVDGKGWAHSIAHGSDLLTEAVKHPSFNNKLTSECLETISKCLFKEAVTENPFIDEEEERLVFILEALIEKDLSEYDTGKWIIQVSDNLYELNKNGEYSLEYFHKRSNVINFLRAFYFRLLYKNELPKIKEQIVNLLEKLHNNIYKASE